MDTSSSGAAERALRMGRTLRVSALVRAICCMRAFWCVRAGMPFSTCDLLRARESGLFFRRPACFCGSPDYFAQDVVQYFSGCGIEIFECFPDGKGAFQPVFRKFGDGCCAGCGEDAEKCVNEQFSFCRADTLEPGFYGTVDPYTVSGKHFPFDKSGAQDLPGVGIMLEQSPGR